MATSEDKNKLDLNSQTQLGFSGGLISPQLQNVGNKKEEKDNSLPDDPGRLGLPVVIEDTSGNRIGNVWSTAQGTELGDAIRNKEKGQAAKVYYDLRKNTFTNFPSSSMTFKDGKIDINVANDVANSDWYKRTFHDDQFKTLAKLYAQDPTGKTKLEITKDDKTEEKTINDLLKEYADYLEKTSKDYQGNIDTRELFKKATNGALVLSDDDLVTLDLYNSIKKGKYSDTDSIPLPTFAKEYFKDYASYNAEDGTVSAKDFFTEFYNIDKAAPDSLKAIIDDLGGGELGDTSEALRNMGESEKDYAIDLLRLGTEREMNSIVSRLEMSKMVAENNKIVEKMRETMSVTRALDEEEKAALTADFVKCYSLYQMVKQDTPDSSSWTGFNLGIQNLAVGFGDSFITNTEKSLNLFGALAWGGAAVVTGAAATVDGLFGFLSGIVKNFFEGGISKVDENFDDIAKSFERSYESVYGEGTMLDEWKDSVLGLSEAIQTRTDLAGNLWGEDFYKDMAQTYATAATMQRIGAMAGYFLNQALITNPVGQAVGEAVGAAVSGALSLVETGETFATLTNMATVYAALGTTAYNTTMAFKALDVLNKIQRASSLAGFAGNILAQGVVDTFLENPALTDALIFGQKEENVIDFQEELRDNIAANVIGEMLPFGGKMLRKGAKKFIVSTTVGNVMQAIARKQVNWFTIKGRKLYQGISEFMTRKSKDTIVEDMGKDTPWAMKVNPEKRMQALRKEIIDIQEKIKQAKIFRGEGSLKDKAGKIDDLIQNRIDLEETLGTAKKIRTAEGKARIERGAGVQYVKETINVDTARLSKLSKKIGQTNLPGSFSTETSDYINDLFNKQILDNKISYLDKSGKTLSEFEQGEYNKLTKRISKYESSLPADYATEYKALAKDYVVSNGRYYYMLNNYLASDAGGNLIPLDQLEKMRANGVYGAYGEQYMKTFAVDDFSDTSEIGKFIYDPNQVIKTDNVPNDVQRFSRKEFSSNTVYADPNYVRNLYVNAYARMSNGAVSGEAVAKIGRTTAVETDSKGNILKTPTDVANAKMKFYKSIESKFEASFKESGKLNDLKDATTAAKRKSPTAYWNTVRSNANKKIKKLLGTDPRGLKRYASTLSSEEISQIGTKFDLPEYSKPVKSADDLKKLYESLGDAQKKAVDKVIPGFSRTEFIGGQRVTTEEAISELQSDLAIIQKESKVDILAHPKKKDIAKKYGFTEKGTTQAAVENEISARIKNLENPDPKAVAAEQAQFAQDAIDHWNSAVLNDNLDVELTRQYVKNNNEILSSSSYKEMVTAKNMQELTDEQAIALKEAKISYKEAETALALKPEEMSPKEIEAFNKQAEKEFNKVVGTTLSDAVNQTVEALMDNPYLEQLIKEYEKIGISSDAAKEYIVLQWLYDNSRTDRKTLKYIAERFYNMNLSRSASAKFSDKFADAADSIIESRLNRTIKKLNDEGVEGLVDMKSTMERVDSYFKDITDLWEAKRIIETWDRQTGKFRYYQVDNSTYMLVTNYPTFKKNNAIARLLARLNSIARIGQITLRAASLVTQGFKDSLNAIVLGGWDTLWLDNPTAYKKIAEYIGPDAIEAFRKELSPGAWKDFLAEAKWQGLTVEEAIAKAEIGDELLDIKIEGPGTSQQYYSARDFTRKGTDVEQIAEDAWVKNKPRWMKEYTGAMATLRNIRSGVSDKLNILHNAREKFLRKQVYRQNFSEALDMGKSLEQARNYASYYMENATTNFSRGFAWGSNIVRSIPYFGAALNGASSMVRLLEIDPVGITTRFLTDLVIPTIGLTVMSLQDPKNAEIYKNIKEYEKEGGIQWVANGEVFSIPLPEELAKFILPIRHAVEKIHDGNDLAWNDLIINDILNMPTIALNDIMMLDEKKLGADPSIGDRLSGLAYGLFNSLAPNTARTAFIAATGKDPYTHADYGKMRYFQDENGEYQLMSVSEYGFCNDLAELFKSWGWEINPTMAEGILSSALGAGTMDILEGIRDFASTAQQGEFNLTAFIAPSLDRASNVLMKKARTDEDVAQTAWYSVINALKEQKAELLSPKGKLAKYSQDIDMAKTADAQAKATEFWYGEVHNWQQKVIDTVRQYNSMFGDYYDRSKFAATLSTMTTDLSINPRKDSTDYYNARALAIETFSDAGFDSPNDGSVFGYMYRDYNTGRTEIKYYDPLVVSMTRNILSGQTDEAVSMITQAVEYSGLKNKYKNEVYPAYNKYMNAKDYNNANKLAADWDVEFMQGIKPILDSYNVGELLNSSVVVDLIDNYILIPNTTEAIGKGKYYSSSTGLNKRRGYAQSYAKKIYNAMKKEK